MKKRLYLFLTCSVFASSKDDKLPDLNQTKPSAFNSTPLANSANTLSLPVISKAQANNNAMHALTYKQDAKTEITEKAKQASKIMQITRSTLKRGNIAAQNAVSTYFYGNMQIQNTIGETPFHHSINPSMFDDLLKSVDLVYKKEGYSRNHLYASIFLQIEHEETAKLLQGLVCYDEVDSKYRTVLLEPSNNKKLALKKQNNTQKIADFISSKYEGAFQNSECKFIHQEPRNTTNSANHGDQLAVAQLKRQPKLLFDITESLGHKKDIKIISGGFMFLSSYDACNDCLTEIVNTKETLTQKFNEEAKNFEAVTDSLPFYQTFIGARPYRDSTYQQYSSESAIKPCDIQYSFSKRKPIYSINASLARSENLQLVQNPILNTHQVFHDCAVLSNIKDNNIHTFIN